MDKTEANKLKAEIARYIANGLKNKDICKLVNINKQRLNYYKNVLKKIGVK